MPATTRREFIKIAGLGTGAAVLGSGLVSNWWGLDPDVVHDPQTEGTVVPTFCEICFWKCGVHAHVRDGRITKIVGNPEHPLSKGRLCPRGTGGMGLVYDPDRLKRPLIRRNRKSGGQTFEEVDWKTALDYTAERILAATKDRPEALALFSHGYGGSWFKQLVKAYGSPNIGAPSDAQCRGGRETAFRLTYGSPVGSPENLDMPNSRAIAFLGSHLGENMHNTQVQDVALAMDRGADLIVVDPRFSTLAGKARHWLPIKPGTDLALLLAWMHVLIEERLYDREYVERYTVGFDKLAAHVKDKTPEWAYTRTTIPPEQIVETARTLAGGRPASLVHPGRRTAWYGDDTQRGRAIAILNALLGSYGRKGGFYFPGAAPVANPWPKAKAPKDKLPADWQRGRSYPFADAVLAHGLRDAAFPGTAAYDLKAWIVYGCNLLMALPEPKRTIEALQQLDFVVAIDVLPTEITGYADVVLPEATYLERYDDIHAPGFREPFLALRQPVVPPPHDQKPGWWIARELAKPGRLDLEEYFPWKDIDEYLGARLADSGYDLAELKRRGVLRTERQPLYLEEFPAGDEPKFCEGSGKIEIYSERMAEAGVPGAEPLPEFTFHAEPSRAAEEYRLLFGRSPVHTFGRTTNNRFLGEIMAENVLWMNARVCEERGLDCGVEVVLVNDSWRCGGCGATLSGKSRPAKPCRNCGAAPERFAHQGTVTSDPLRLKKTQRIRSDCVYMVHGFGHKQPAALNFANGRGASDADLQTAVAVDPVNGGTGMNVNFVRVERADRATEGAA